MDKLVIDTIKIDEKEKWWKVPLNELREVIEEIIEEANTQEEWIDLTLSIRIKHRKT